MRNSLSSSFRLFYLSKYLHVLSLFYRFYLYILRHHFSQHTAITCDNVESAKTQYSVSENGEAMTIFRRNNEFSTKKQADNPENDSVTSMLIGGDEIDVEFNLQTGDIKKACSMGR